MNSKRYNKNLGPRYHINKPKFNFESAAKEEQVVESTIISQLPQQEALKVRYGKNAKSYKNILEEGREKEWLGTQPFSQPQSVKHQQQKKPMLGGINHRVKHTPLLKTLETTFKNQLQEEYFEQTKKDHKNKSYKQYTQEIFDLPKLKQDSTKLLRSFKNQSSINLGKYAQEHQQQQEQEQQQNSVTISQGMMPKVMDNSRVTDTDKFFSQKGLNTNKRLKQYDCWGEEISPHFWVEKYKGQELPHASCPIFVDNKYIWTDVELIGYNEKEDKYIIRVIETDVIKEVVRLSIKFRDEDTKAFKERVELSKQRQLNAEDEIRFQKYVEAQDDRLISSLSKIFQEHIIFKVNQPNKYRSEHEIAIAQNNKSYQMTKQALMESLLTEVKGDYSRFMKKCIILMEMSNPLNEAKWIKQRIKNRTDKQEIPRLGVIKKLIYDKEELYMNLKLNHISRRVEIVKTLKSIAQRTFMYENHKLFQIQWKPHEVPMLLTAFDSNQKNYHYNSKSQLSMQWRDYIISDIQDQLQNVYTFYTPETKLYNEKPELKNLLKRIDFMFNTYIRQNVVKKSICDYSNFIRSYLLPKDVMGDSKGLEQWQIKETPLLILHLQVSSTFQGGKGKDGKKQKKEEKDKKQEEKEQKPTELIYFEPSYEQVQQVILNPLSQLVQTCNSYMRLEKDLVPLIDLQRMPAFQISEDLEWLQEGRQQILEFLELSYQEPKHILEQFKEFSFLIEKSQKQIIKDLFGDSKEKPHISSLDSDLSRSFLKKYNQAKFSIQKLCIDNKNGRLFQIKTKQAKEQLVQKANEVIKVVLQKIAEIAQDNVERIMNQYSEMKTQIETKPDDEAKLLALKSVLSEIDVNLARMNTEVDNVKDFIKIMEDNFYEFGEDLMQQFWNLKIWPGEIKGSQVVGKRAAEKWEGSLKETLQQEKDEFEKELKDLDNQYCQYILFDNINEVQNYINTIHDLDAKINAAQEKKQNFNSRENSFKEPITEYLELGQLATEFKPFVTMWDTVMYFNETNQWLQESLIKQDSHFIEKELDKWYKTCKDLLKQFKEKEENAAQTVCEKLKSEIEKFRKYQFLFTNLTSEAMKKPKAKHHWEEIFELCQLKDNDKVGKQIEILANLEEITLEKLMNFGMNIENPEHRGSIEDVSRKALKQWEIEKKLKEMEDKLKEIEIQTQPYKNTGTFVLKGVDDVLQILDDQLNLLMMIKASPYIKGNTSNIRFANQIENRIVLIQDTLEGWIKCQRSWMYLEPIFASDDIKKKMELEKKKFDGVDTNFRDTMRKFSVEKNLWEGIDSEKLKLEFNRDNEKLDQIQKSLSEYLETKRRYFPRFYFLSDEELLEILADTKDPLKVQKHINKCFEAINQLKFENGFTVTGMISAEKELVGFNKHIDVNEGARKGNVEIWLLEIEQVMKDTLMGITKQAIQDVATQREEWVQKWPAQIILAVNMMRWTEGAEVCISPEQKSSSSLYSNLDEYSEFLQKQLKSIVALVRTDLSDLVRLTLAALIVLDVHAKDVTEQLAYMKISSIQDFNWISQLRYNWEEQRKENVLWVNMINASLKFGFEYLGNSNRLVITPLTDRCYRTLMGAFHLNYGGAPEGPAGTGKTETTKDLAKAVGVQCVVFNCSDQLNYLAMRKFFKGLASSGAWCCFDEFNRIDLEVLSVIAQQVLTIQNAIREKKKVFEFDGEDISLIPSCAINITMNPGYAGRSELPDNLKALFRSCAMMVPDYALIAEIYFYSVGFEDARNLARKVVASLRLSSEQLSSQAHYDFGMRALKAILTAAGNLKRQMDAIEDIVCLRALRDVNIPKFTKNDIPLFISITNDLFPGVEMPEIEYGKLIDALQDACVDQNLQKEEGFLAKCIQLYDTINVRHGLMTVGNAGSGKTCILHVLQAAQSSLKGYEKFEHTATHKLNPKAITSDQLYGKLDPDTKQWTDGVVAIIMRNCAADNENPEKKWIVFDGPVDAVWIENMNTVLDDNKKLCLSSGEIIKLSNMMTMIFEVEDLSQASPATVSRCGMVFLEPDILGWAPLVKSYCNTIPEKLKEHAGHLETILIWLYDVTLAWSAKFGKFLVHNSEQCFVASGMKYIDTFLDVYRDREDEKPVKIPGNITDVISEVALFGVIWSVGAALEEGSRKGFHELVSKLITDQSDIPEEFQIQYELKFPFEPHAIKVKIPEKTSLFELSFNQESHSWMHWLQTQPKYQIPKTDSYQDLIIPTSDSIRNNYFLNLCLKNKIHLLICGNTGTGKTVNISNELNTKYYNIEWTNLQTAFSGQTQANQVQRLVESKVNTKRRKRQYGPEDGKKYICIFIDDLNMPQKEIYGAQPPIEILRQWMDTGGWYDLETKEFKTLLDITFVNSMLPPTGGRNVVTQRYIRHLNLLYVEPFEQQSLFIIFNNILTWFFQNKNINAPAIVSLQERIINSTIELYHKIQNSNELLPTPSKSHYIYNLRDISKVFQGISVCSSKALKSDSDFIKLWAHECQRVFQDRLINKEDQTFLENILKDIVKVNFQKVWDDLVTVQPLLFASFIPTIASDKDPKKKESDIYCELTDRDEVKKICYEKLDEYNNFYVASRMNLVLFDAAIQHIIKIVRVLNTSFGHCLLVGVGGSGRKSLATLSSFISDKEPFNIDQRNWIEELQRLMKNCGLEQNDTVFLFSDTQIINESMVEDISNMLNNGEVPNLFPNEEKQKILEEFNEGTNNEKYGKFIQNCKEKLHLCLTFSPVGDAFRRRLRTFPALVNCTTIDWFLPWPEEALRSTAKNHFIKEMNIDDEHLVDGLVNVAVDMQQRITNLSRRYLQELRKYYYVTPTSYLQLLETFKLLKTQKTVEIDKYIDRYTKGVETIKDAEEKVENLQKDLEVKKPVLKKKQEENKQLLKSLKENEKEANAKKKICDADAQECAIQRSQANKIREDCQQALDLVVPKLQEAANALLKIKSKDIDEVKSFKTPSSSVVLVMKGVIQAFDEDKGVAWKPKPDGKPGEKFQDFWEYAQKKVLNGKLTSRLKGFQEEQIKAMKNIQKLKELLKLEEADEEKIFKSSSAAGNIFIWIRNVVETYDALLIVEPKRKELAEAEAALKLAEDKLAEKQAALQKVLDTLEELKKNFEKADKEEKELNADYKDCEKKLNNATKLIEGLSSEKESWTEKAHNYRINKTTVMGDTFLASGIIAYLGAFPIDYREEVKKAWMTLFMENKIIADQKFTLSMLVSDVEISKWVTEFKLPNDQFSIDNSIIREYSTKWPLMIDPQQQANQWIKNMYNNTKINIIRPTDITPQKLQKLSALIENSISLGYKILFENIGEDIEPLFEPILQLKLVKSGNTQLLKFGDKEIEYSPDFKFIMTTKLPRPHYPPEVCVKVTLLNFQVTQKGLMDNLLNFVMRKEYESKVIQMEKSMVDINENNRIQKELETQILELLFTAGDNILDSQELINTLESSKQKSESIKDKQVQQQKERDQFDNLRNSYNEVGKRISHLYFVILDLSNLEPTYQWSLEYYTNIFSQGISKAQDLSKDNKENKMINIIDCTQVLIYENISRSLLEKDKLIYSFLLCMKILESEEQIDQKQIRFMMVGGTWTESPKEISEDLPFLTHKMWCSLQELSVEIGIFKGFDDFFAENLETFEPFFNHEKPYELELPGEWEGKLNNFQKLLVTRILYPEKFSKAVQHLIMKDLGERYITPPKFNLAEAFEPSTPFTPLIFILSSGADPREPIEEFAADMDMKQGFKPISLGQGQGEMAERALLEAAEQGRWVLFQNCHLAPSFMPDLERLLENLSDNTHTNFRCWLTSMPSDKFPQQILVKGIKMTYEPPKGLKTNLDRCFLSQDAKSFETSNKPKAWKKLFFGLSFFHALILERRKFGPLGWNIPYAFTSSDFAISFSQLKMFLDEFESIPYEALNYMVAEANYGGRVTDDKDRRLIKTILLDFYTENILDDNYKFSESGIYFAPQEGNLASYKEYINTLPINDSPEVFGLHPNAEISSSLLETNFITSTILSLLPRTTGSGGKKPEDIVKEKIEGLLHKLPKNFDTKEAERLHPISYNESMNTVLVQELIRFNKLLSVVKNSLINVSKAIDGLIVMSEDLELVYDGVFDNKVPNIWHKVSYPSLKPMGSWILNLVERLEFMDKWIQNGSPPSYWISGFFFTQSFLTGTLQNYARKHNLPIDTLIFTFQAQIEDMEITKPPEDGCYIYGLYFDGARWDYDNGIITESQPKVLYSKVPIIKLEPTNNKILWSERQDVYELPVYKTSQRAGTLSTTGHSTNFVMPMYLPISEEHKPAHWIKRGVAALTQLDD